MGRKLYPPVVEGHIPAFARPNASKKVTPILRVPFQHSQMVSLNEIGDYVCKIKTINTGNVIAIIEHGVLEGDNIISFSIENSIEKQLKIGQFYKIQIAYKNLDNEIGYYSDVTVTKYTATPNIEIVTGKINNITINSGEFVGRYYWNKNQIYDLNERAYQYKFDIYEFSDSDKEDTLFDTSGLLSHKQDEDITNYAVNDIIGETIDRYKCKKDFEKGKKYYIVYTVITTNNLEFKTKQIITNKQDVLSLPGTFEIESKTNNYDGLVTLYLRSRLVTHINGQKQGVPCLITGSFLLSRASSIDNYTIWEEIGRFSLKNKECTPSHYDDINKIYEDYTVEHGIRYVYAIQQFNSYGIMTAKNFDLENNDVSFTRIANYIDFDDMILYDNEHFLKIKYNPKISSFKINILEQKQETIGNQYPFIFRNGNVHYKEFPISGLLSFQMDEIGSFIKTIENEATRRKTARGIHENQFLNEAPTDLTFHNIQKEREFKMNVLNWLTNGKPKVFKSPTEGCFIVRLMNTSLTPNDTLGRMIHSFQSTAYEIADFTWDNLIKLNLIKSIDNQSNDEPIATQQLIHLYKDNLYKNKFNNKSFSLRNAYNSLTKVNKWDNCQQLPIMYNVFLEHFYPGTPIDILIVDEQPLRIYMNSTGSYHVLTEKGIKDIIVHSDQAQGSVHFMYYIKPEQIDAIEGILDYGNEVRFYQFNVNENNKTKEWNGIEGNHLSTMEQTNSGQISQPLYNIVSEAIKNKLDEEFPDNNTKKYSIQRILSLQLRSIITPEEYELNKTYNGNFQYNIFGNRLEDNEDDDFTVKFTYKNGDNSSIQMQHVGIYNLEENELIDLEDISIGVGVQAMVQVQILYCLFENSENELTNDLIARLGGS